MADKKAKVYIAGKITGDSLYREKFSVAQQALEEEGYIVLNPAMLPEGLSRSEYMRICFQMIDIADAVAFIDGFLDSQGAKLELEYCKYIKKHALTVYVELRDEEDVEL